MSTLEYHPISKIFPLLDTKDLDALIKDIKANGLHEPIWLFEKKILDGRNRYLACRSAKVEIRTREFRGKDPVAFCISLNLHRRHLNESQRSMVADRLATLPSGVRSDRQGAQICAPTQEDAAKMLNVSRRNVQHARTVREASMPELTHAVDNGKLKVSTAVNLVKTGKDFTQAVLTKVQQDSATVKNAMKAVKEEQNAVLAKKIKTAKLDRYHLFHASCEVLLEQEAERFDWIITDPPYPKEFLPAFDLLGKVAAHTLKPGGSLLCMAGQSYLPAVMASLSTYLNYCWVLAYLTPGGQSVQIFPRKVNTFWKPVLWFVKGACNAKEWIGDVTRSDINDNDKRYHDWGQSESGMHDLVKRFVRPGHTILDPFVGAGTTGVAVLREGGLFTGYDIDKSAIDQSTVRLEKENEK